MSDYDDILIEITVGAPGSVLAMQQLELKALLRDFCDRTSAWVVPAPFTLQVGVRSYSIILREGVANRLMNVVNSGSTPVEASLAITGEIVLPFAPSVVDAYTANIALIPDQSAPVEVSVPDWVWQNYHNAIVDGVLGRLYMQTAKTYSNPRLAMMRTASYSSAVMQAKNEMLARYRFRGTGWRFPQIAPGNRRR